MSDKDVKLAIQSAVKSFASGDINDQSITLFQILGYNTARQNPFPKKTFSYFKDSFLEGNLRFNEDKAQVKEWKFIDLLFQLTREELSGQKSLFDTGRVKWEGQDKETVIETYLFFALELVKAEYTRTALAQITREINKVFPMPVMVIFKYGEHLTLSVINRRLNKKDERKDVLEKVTLIKDISIVNPHRAHIEILFDLSFKELQRIHKVTGFVELHNAWQKTLDTRELNKRFYRELSNWYFWAMREVIFPGADLEADKTGLFKKEDKVREHNAKNLIRLLTRILFVWFIKEKNLVPDVLFDETYIRENLISDFVPRKRSGFNHKTQGSKYYRAILQNLFFATLNQTIGKRGFRKEGQQMNVTNLMRYESYFKNPEAFINLVEEVVPFMNGGLFECLDSPDPLLKGKKGGDVINYEDGFSDRKDNSLCVPDYIFFGVGENADLSEELGNKKQKDVTVNGLINILKSYKFTITENTPIEEDIALDPELLGRVFENLLASYNPETRTTARKQTGSFYTPREIVSYMVDESLKAHFKQKLETEAGMSPLDAETGLELLLGYNEKEHLFDEKQTAVLISAIDTCKILDPACGSGAFPMGILHKLVHILHKLDPYNRLWKERQIEKVDGLIKEAGNINDSAIRDKIIFDLEANKLDIEESFANNELDYGRKLYLIENCIYGVDIQPIATQISKLRFFISLIVDQKSDKSKDNNFGIRPLPNLETKFVAANTLIGIEKPAQQLLLFENPKVKELEEKLKDVRHRLFSAKTPITKRKLRDEDQKLREQMGNLLIQQGWGNETARQLAAWDPYNQNVNSPFFDPEWMFGVAGGFDLVIGNPPYINISNLRPDEYRLTLRSKFRSARNKSDTYAFFLEQGFILLKKNGTLSYIIPQTWKATDSFSKLREIIFKEKSLVKVIDLDFSTFDSIVKPMVVLILNEFGKSKTVEIFDQSFSKISEILIDEVMADSTLSFNTSLSDNQKRINKLIENGSVRIETIIQFSRGIKTSDDKRFIHNTQKNSDYKQVYRGKNIKSYQLNWGGEYIWYRPDLMKEKVGSVSYTKDLFEVPEKLITQRVNSSMQLLCAYDNKKNYFIDTTLFSRYETWDNKTSLKYLCSILNSTLINYWYCNKYLMPTIGIYELHSIPIKISMQQDKYSIIADYIIGLKEKQINSSFFEDLIDAMVYELYFPEEIKFAGCEVLKYITNLPELKDGWYGDEKKLAVIEKVYTELSDPNHPVAIAMEKQKAVPEVRIIEGLDK